MLANFYSSVFTREPDGGLPKIDKVQCEYEFEDRDFNSEEIRKLLEGLNTTKSSGPDGLHPLALKELREVIEKPLATIFYYLQTGIVRETVMIRLSGHVCSRSILPD